MRCALPGCRNPVSPGRKYCSQSCAGKMVGNLRKTPAHLAALRVAQKAAQSDPTTRRKRAITRTSVRVERIWKRSHPYLAQWEFRQLRSDVIRRDGGRCVRCKKKKARLGVHHVVPVRDGFLSRLCDRASNLVTVCVRCHRLIHGDSLSDHWKDFLPEAGLYLARFGYKKCLLGKFLSVRHTPIQRLTV